MDEEDRELCDIKKFIITHPTYNISSTMYDARHKDINQDQGFFDTTLKLEMHQSLAEKMLARKPKLKQDIVFAKKFITSFANSAVAIELWKLHMATVLQDKQYIVSVIKNNPLSEVVTSFVAIASDTLEKDLEIVKALIRTNRFDLGFNLHINQLVKDLEFVKYMMKINPLSKITKKLWASNIMTVPQDKNFVKDFLKLHPRSDLATEVWGRSKKGVGVEQAFVKDFVQTAPTSTIAEEMWDANKDKLDRDLQFAKVVVQAHPTSNIAKDLWKIHKEKLKLDLNFIKEIIKSSPDVKISIELWTQKKAILSQDNEFTKDFILANNKSNLAYQMWLRSEDKLINENDFIKELLKTQPSEQLSTHICNDIYETKEQNFHVELCGAIDHRSSCGRILSCPEIAPEE